MQALRLRKVGRYRLRENLQIQIQSAEKAYDRFCADGGENSEDYRTFAAEQAYWLDDYSLFMAIKDDNGGVSWSEWPQPLKNRETSALAEARETLAGEIGFYKFQQYEFDRQWKKLHAYVNEKRYSDHR